MATSRDCGGICRNSCGKHFDHTSNDTTNFGQTLEADYNVTCLIRKGIPQHSPWHLASTQEHGNRAFPLGIWGLTRFELPLIGTTAEGFLNHTPCSALTIKPEGFEYSLF
ncbi:hypothetical protein OAE39_00810 [Akkermansiaceae bacterium]|nr:hypothetical protein [Akkermansiaceae bacterium]